MVKKHAWLFVLCLETLLLPQIGRAKTLTLAYPTPTWNTGLPIAVAQDRGFFTSEGFDVNAVLIRGGPTVMAALVSGDADYAIVAGVPAVTSIVRGAPLVIVGGYSKQLDYVLMGAKRIVNVNDLRGRQIGVTGPGGMAEFATVEALARKGLYRDKDYTIVYGGNSPARVSALEAGGIQAAPFSSGERVALERRGYPMILDIGETLSELPFLVIVTSKHKAQSAPKEVESFLSALKKAMDVIEEKYENAITVGVRKRLRGDANAERQTIAIYAKNYSINISAANINALIRAAKLQSDAAKIGGADSFFNPRFAQNVAAKSP